MSKKAVTTITSTITVPDRYNCNAELIPMLQDGFYIVDAWEWREGVVNYAGENGTRAGLVLKLEKTA